MDSIMSSLMLGGYQEEGSDIDYTPEPDFPDVPQYCLTKMNSQILVNLFDEADKVVCGSPYIIKKDNFWPLGFGRLATDSDEYYESDIVYAVHPDGYTSVDVAEYGSDWVIYIGPENEPLWAAIEQFQKGGHIDTPEEQHGISSVATEEVFEPVEVEDLPF